LTNTRARAQTAANAQNVGPEPIALDSGTNVRPTTTPENQWTAVATPAPAARASGGKISAISSQKIGPSPIANAAM
jgi:hypothetical protein